MSLSNYNRKRNFKETVEPAGKVKRKKIKDLIFVVQQHSASHLHYDLRLEMEGVLKSWAVPKGPSLNPDDKRLAMMVEDHPYEYKDFEGTIPEGNYGAGNVIIWDHGTYTSLDPKLDRAAAEKELLAGLHKGHISFILKGKKLKGEFALIRINRRSENSNEWLLVKKNDKYAGNIDVLKKNKSVVSGKALVMRKNTTKRKSTATRPDEDMTLRLPKGAVKKKALKIAPMLATLHDSAFNNSDWIFEIKYDGFRALALCQGKDHVTLYSRNLLSFNKNYPSLVEELKKIKDDVILDGEIVVENSKGRSEFQLLQNYQRNGKGNLKYYVFDLLSFRGHDLTRLPLIERKDLLQKLLAKYQFGHIHYSDHISSNGIGFLKQAEKFNLEGIIAKKKNSVYEAGRRSGNWLKIKISKQQEVVILGITEPAGSRKHFGSLILGVYEDGKPVYAGNCGTGFSDEVLSELYKKFKKEFTNKPALENFKRFSGKIQWMNPVFVCEVKFTEWTTEGSMRHPVYLGLRNDKKPAEVKRELTTNEKNAMRKNTVTKIKDNKGSRENLPDEDRTLLINKKPVILTNQNKIYWPDEGYRKKDLIEYYSNVSDFIIPYLKDRPESLHRFPNGIKGESFFQKDIDSKKVPQWIRTQKFFSESTDDYVNYLICNDKASLLYMANLGCIEINPWSSTIKRPDHPDWLVIDLDPEDIPFSEVIKAALVVRKLLEDLEVESFCKTSGATGLHIYVPLGAKYEYEIAKRFAELIANATHEYLPDSTSVLRNPAKRKKKIYLDFLQNRKGQTLAAPYSVRPRAGATVSTPLEWQEVNKRLDPKKFTMINTLRRLDKKGDLWKGVLGKGVNIRKILSSNDLMSDE